MKKLLFLLATLQIGSSAVYAAAGIAGQDHGCANKILFESKV